MPAIARNLLPIVVTGLLAACGGSASPQSVDVTPPPAPIIVSVAGGDAVSEGAAGASLRFQFSLSAASGSNIEISYETRSDTASQGVDFEARTDVITIPAGSIFASIEIVVIDDADDEPNETVIVAITAVSSGQVGEGSASGTIQDDDDPTVLSGLSERPSNTTCVAPDRPVQTTSITTEDAFPALPLLAQPVGLLQAPGDPSEWFVIEKGGRVVRFDNAPSVSATSTFIDIRSPTDPIDVESGPSEAGLLGMAFHPDYGDTNWYVYLSYNLGGPLRSVIARFESKDNGLTLDAADATVLITLTQPYPNHNGGQIAFGPDGYLYIHFGDGGSGGDPGDRAQNTSNLFGAMLRIDVEGGTPYGIPADNPFSGNGLCNDGDGPQACPEIYAWGLRNAWKWSFDDVTGQLWLGDVGQNAWEEIDLIELGGNYGWRCREGAHDYNLSGVCPPGLIDPVIEYSHAVGNAVTGGYVYRGRAIAELAGRYVFADYGTGKIFASTDEGGGQLGFEELLDSPYFISAFAPEANGELLFLNYGGGDIQRIVSSGGGSTDLVATELSASGCVDPTDPTQPAVGLIPYELNAPFWSDGAAKERWYAIPDNATIDVAADGDWLFPIGSVLVKNFRLGGQLIETRLFMRHTDGQWAGYSYEWNDTQTEATRLFGGKTKSIAGQEWIYPSGSECLQCHTAAANFSLGLEHGQLNRDLTYPSSGLTANQLGTADAVDLLTLPLSDAPANLPRFAEPDDTAASLESRARSYLHSNCAGCHRPGGPTPSGMDLRHDTGLQATNTCDVVPASGDLGIAGARLIAPGDPASSLLVVRASRRDAHGMPPLGSNIVDAAGVQLLSEWITGLNVCP